LQGAASAAKSELSHWLTAAYSASPSMYTGAVDTNGDNVLDSSDTIPATGAVASTFISVHNGTLNERSPFDPTLNLYIAGTSAGNGQIALQQNGKIITIKAFKEDGVMVFSDRVVAE
jgi:hypothetical protein